MTTYSLREQLDILFANVNAAIVSYTCWTTLHSINGNEPIEKTVYESYNHFFGVVSSALQSKVVMLAYRLLDKRLDVVSFPNIVQRINQEKNLNLSIDNTVSEIWEYKIKPIRNKSVAHFDAQKKQNEIYSEASLIFGELEFYLDSLKALLNQMCMIPDFNLVLLWENNQVKKDTIRLLQDLHEHTQKII